MHVRTSASVLVYFLDVRAFFFFLALFVTKSSVYLCLAICLFTLLTGAASLIVVSLSLLLWPILSQPRPSLYSRGTRMSAGTQRPG